MSLANLTFLGNSVTRWIFAIGITTVVFAVAWVLRRHLRCRRERLAGRAGRWWQDVAMEVGAATKLPLVFLLALQLGTRTLLLSGDAPAVLNKLSFVALLLQLAIWFGAGVSYAVEHSIRARTGDGSHVTTMRAIGLLLKIAFLSILLLWGLDNLGVNITTLVAGLGVGGIAVALAVQNILGDLFGSLSIVLDKPFVVGDFISVDEKSMGTIERIGLKTTRVRSLTGEQLIFPNGDLLRSRIHNFKRMRERRVEFHFRVDYRTEPTLLERIPAIVKGLVQKNPKTRFEAAHLKELATWALDFQVVYWVLDPDVNLYMDIQQRINLGLLRAFREEGIDLAVPSAADQAMDRAG